MVKLFRPKPITQEEVNLFCELAGIEAPQYTRGWLGYDDALVPEALVFGKLLQKIGGNARKYALVNTTFRNPMLAGRKLSGNWKMTVR